MTWLGLGSSQSHRDSQEVLKHRTYCSKAWNLTLQFGKARMTLRGFHNHERFFIPLKYSGIDKREGAGAADENVGGGKSLRNIVY